MTSSKNTSATTTLTDLALDLCWGAWAELGVSGWRRTHQDWAVDPEPLLLVTAWIGEADPRLRDESLDWCVHHWRYVSKIRLKNLVSQGLDGPQQAAWGEFAATINEHAGTAWPRPTKALDSYRATGKSTLRSLAEPALVCLRMRAMFGMSARAEILCHLLLVPDVPMTVAQLANATLYTKRNVAEECDTLQRAGVLAVRAESNRFYYSLADRASLTGFVGDLPSVRPDWRALFGVITRLVDLERRAESLSEEVRNVEMHRTLRDLEQDLVALGVGSPGRNPDLAYTETFLPWAEHLLRVVAEGRWPSRRTGR